MPRLWNSRRLKRQTFAIYIKHEFGAGQDFGSFLKMLEGYGYGMALYCSMGVAER